MSQHIMSDAIRLRFGVVRGVLKTPRGRHPVGETHETLPAELPLLDTTTHFSRWDNRWERFNELSNISYKISTCRVRSTHSPHQPKKRKMRHNQRSGRAGMVRTGLARVAALDAAPTAA